MPTVNAQIATGNDDVFESATGVMNLSAASIGALTTGNQWAGLRFAGLTIPPGVTSVTTAPLQMFIPAAGTNITLVADFYGEAADNAAAFAATANNVSSRAKTTAKVSVNTTAAGTGIWHSVELAPVVQEILTRPGWASGNALVIILDALPGIDWLFRAYEGGSSQAAKLDITYLIGGLPVKSSYYAQMRGA